MHTCGWCTKNYQSWQERCSSCGGPMPPLPGMDPGPEPAPAPREIPSSFVRAQKWSRNPLILGGTFMTVGGGAVFMALAYLRSWFAVIPLAALLLGGYIFRAGCKEAARVLAAFRFGRVVKGSIVMVQLDSHYQVNHRHPWRIDYSFKASDGVAHRGSAVTFDSSAPTREAGQPVWVLVVDGHPEQNTIYPPVK